MTELSLSLTNKLLGCGKSLPDKDLPRCLKPKREYGWHQKQKRNNRDRGYQAWK